MLRFAKKNSIKWDCVATVIRIKWRLTTAMCGCLTVHKCVHVCARVRARELVHARERANARAFACAYTCACARASRGEVELVRVGRLGPIDGGARQGGGCYRAGPSCVAGRAARFVSGVREPPAGPRHVAGATIDADTGISPLVGGTGTHRRRSVSRRRGPPPPSREPLSNGGARRSRRQAAGSRTARKKPWPVCKPSAVYRTRWFQITAGPGCAYGRRPNGRTAHARTGRVYEPIDKYVFVSISRLNPHHDGHER